MFKFGRVKDVFIKSGDVYEISQYRSKNKQRM